MCSSVVMSFEPCVSTSISPFINGDEEMHHANYIEVTSAILSRILAQSIA